MICPICASALAPEQRRCPGCQTDLTVYLSLAHQPDLLFNEALNCMGREDFSEACDLLCQASALRPEDAQIRLLWMRASYGGGDLKKAISLAIDLLEQAPSAELNRQYERLLLEYEWSVSSPEALARGPLLRQNDRLEALIERLERVSAKAPQEQEPNKGEGYEPL